KYGKRSVKFSVWKMAFYFFIRSYLIIITVYKNEVFHNYPLNIVPSKLLSFIAFIILFGTFPFTKKTSVPFFDMLKASLILRAIPPVTSIDTFEVIGFSSVISLKSLLLFMSEYTPSTLVTKIASRGRNIFERIPIILSPDKM